ncbi:MAG: serine/threonine-protein kinase [Myxococcota bacterium]
MASSHSFELGRYVVMGTLGRGGMGVVFKAFDSTLDRLVALKVLHREVDEMHTSRLRREAQAMAKLSHPNVVQVYEVGEADGQTFVAMEMVAGQRLDEWMRQHPRPQWRACVDVFSALGAGLAAAHEQGLVHRDFKPGNAIIDDDGRPRVLDFGLARHRDELTEDGTVESARTREQEGGPLEASLTRTGTILGTPAYMPPEQMSGALTDARSDQFSFCVALYEALYGQRPYPGDTLAALKVSLQGGMSDPAPRGSAVPASLRTVVLRGLAIAPEERWPSMEALLEQLRDLATPRRRRGAALAVVVGMAAVGAGLELPRYAEWSERCTGARAQLDGIWDDARRQQVEAAVLGTNLPYAADTWKRVEPRLDDYAQTWAARHTEACEMTRLRGEQTEEAMSLRMACLRTRRTALDAAVTVLVQADDTAVRNAVKLTSGLPELHYCDDLDALERQRQRVPPPEDPQVAEEVEGERERLAEIEAMYVAGLFAAALEEVERVVTRAEALGYGPLLAEARGKRGQLREANGLYVEAEKELTEAYTLAVEHDHETVQLSSASLLVFLVGTRLQRPAPGRQWSRVAQPLAVRIGEPRGVATSWGNLGLLLTSQGEYDEAQKAHANALATMEDALGAEHFAVARHSNNMGTVFDFKGEFEQAQAAHERTLRILEAALGPAHPDVAGSCNNLGIVLWSRGRYEEARSTFERALRILEKALGRDHPVVAQTLNNLGIALESQGRYGEAQRAYERALRVLENALGPDHPVVARSWDNLGNVLTSQGQYKEASESHERALRIRETAQGAEHPEVANSWNNLGVALSNQGKYEEAKDALQRARDLWQEALGPDHPDVSNSWDNLGTVLRKQGEHEEAKAAFAEALAIRDKALGPEHPEVAATLVGLATVALEQDDFDAARAYGERAVSIRERGEVGPEELAEARLVLARALWSEPGQRDRARRLAEQARSGFAEAGAGQREGLAEAEQWLAKHHEH